MNGSAELEPELFGATPSAIAGSVRTNEVEGRSSAIEARETVFRLACFSLLVVVIAFAMNAAISAGLRRVKTSSYGSWNKVMQGNVNADIIVSGSSRAAYHYDPRTVEAVTGHSAYNLGRAGTQTDVQVAVLKAYLEHNRKPLLVIHNLDAFSFVSSHEIFDPALYVPYLNDREIYDPLSKIDHSLYKSRYIPLYGYVVEDMNLTWITGLNALFGRSPREDYFLGFSPREKVWTDDFQKYKDSNPRGVSFPVEDQGVQSLRDLIIVCEQNQIPLLFVYSPEYSEMQAITNNRSVIFGQFRALGDRYNVPVWDYSTWKHDGDTAYFYNSQHLNAQGAAVFSDDFALRLKDYLSTGFKINAEQQITTAVDHSTRSEN
jgi:hypothetical protein